MIPVVTTLLPRTLRLSPVTGGPYTTAHTHAVVSTVVHVTPPFLLTRVSKEVELTVPSSLRLLYSKKQDLFP